MTRMFVPFALLLAACVGAVDKADVTDDFSGLADEKSDSFSHKMTIVSTLADPQGSVQFDYAAQPIYRAIKLHGVAGDWIKITVSANGKEPVDAQQPDAVTFLLDSKFKVVAKNDDANQTTSDSHIVTQLRKSGTFYVVVRDYNYASVAFHAELQMARASGDLLVDANAWYQFFFFDDYADLGASYAVAVDQMPKAAKDDANGFFKQDVGGGYGFALPYTGTVMYMLPGGSDGEAFDARPYDANGNPIAPIAEGGDHSDIVFVHP